MKPLKGGRSRAPLLGEPTGPHGVRTKSSKSSSAAPSRRCSVTCTRDGHLRAQSALAVQAECLCSARDCPAADTAGPNSGPWDMLCRRRLHAGTETGPLPGRKPKDRAEWYPSPFFWSRSKSRAQRCFQGHWDDGLPGAHMWCLKAGGIPPMPRARQQPMYQETGAGQGHSTCTCHALGRPETWGQVPDVHRAGTPASLLPHLRATCQALRQALCFPSPGR